MVNALLGVSCCVVDDDYAQIWRGEIDLPALFRHERRLCGQRHPDPLPPRGLRDNLGHAAAEHVPRAPRRELPRGERIRVALSTEPQLVAEVTRQALDALGVTEGSEVYAAFKATALEPYR